MSDETKKSNRRKYIWGAKIVLAVGLCWLVLRKTDLNELIGLAKRAGASGSVWLGIVLFPGIILLGACRWHRLLLAGRVKISYGEVLGLTLIGNFFSNALPSLIGGDVVKLYYVMKSHPDRKSHVTISWIADRVTGIAGLAIICLIAIAAGWSDPLVQKVRGPIFLVAGLVAFGLTVLLVPGLATKMHLGKLAEKLPFQNFVDQLRQAAKLYSAQPGVWVLAIGLSMVVQMIQLSCIYLGGRTLAPGPSYHSYLVLLPPVLMISSLPITPGAVGWMETAYQTMFGPAGVSGTAALSLSLFHRFARLLWSLPGLWFYIKGPKLKVKTIAAGDVLVDE